MSLQTYEKQRKIKGFHKNYVNTPKAGEISYFINEFNYKVIRFWNDAVIEKYCSECTTTENS